MNSLFQLDIPKRNTCCAGKGERLLSGMEVISLLTDGENKAAIRRDFCLACWAEFPKETLSSAKGYWRSKIEHKEPPQGSNRVARALHLLKQAIKESHPDEAEIFVLALFLAHARQLILRKEFLEGSVSYHLYEIAKQDEFITIRLVDLSQEQIDLKQKSLAMKLM